jgi:dTDP-4-dehydrorhamnose reductase
MKVLILGGEGMIGNGLVRNLSRKINVGYTVRGLSARMTVSQTGAARAFCGVDVANLQHLETILSDYAPDFVINAVGLVKQKMSKGDEVKMLELNSVLPYRLAFLAEKFRFRLIILSTDCVFAGVGGRYDEESVPDARDLYGRSKLLGEISDNSQVLTIRISTVGLELGTHKGLVEWFLNSRGPINGFRKAIYTGFTTIELSSVIFMIFNGFPTLSGLFHISSEPISKLELLQKLGRFVGKTDVQIIPETNFACDRSLNSDKFRNLTGYTPPSWDLMLSELAAEIINRRDK